MVKTDSNMFGCIGDRKRSIAMPAHGGSEEEVREFSRDCKAQDQRNAIWRTSTASGQTSRRIQRAYITKNSRRRMCDAHQGIAGSGRALVTRISVAVMPPDVLMSKRKLSAFAA